MDTILDEMLSQFDNGNMEETNRLLEELLQAVG